MCENKIDVKKYKIVTYGCQMNVHESEKVAGILEGMGYFASEILEEADLVVFNTCCIRDTAEKRAFGNIGALKSLKKAKKDMMIVVLGCMTEQEGYPELVKTKYPFVDIVLGTKNISMLKSMIEERLSTKKRVFSRETPKDFLDADEKTPMCRTSFPNAWINIMYGCDNFCSYCIVPYVRGREISRDFDKIVSEAKRVVGEGYKEITLLGQNVNSYNGGDGRDFAALLKEISNIEGKFRIRFMTSHPKDLTPEVVDVIKNSDKICNNIHLPVQSGSTKVLKEMNRKYSKEHYLSLVEMIRFKLGDDVGITSDVMVGFPGETDEDFAETLDLVKKARFSSAFTFIYSVRKGTVAARLLQIPYEVKKRRIGELIKLQNSITRELSLEYLDGIYEVLVEDVSPKHENSVCGRTDSGRLVTMTGGEELVGKFVEVQISGMKSASLIGEIVRVLDEQA